MRAGRGKGLRSGAAGSPSDTHPANENKGTTACVPAPELGPQNRLRRSTETLAPP
jgi:hypothetical protein